MVIFHSYVSLPDFQWVNPLFLWPFSIAMLNYQRVIRWKVSQSWNVFKNRHVSGEKVCHGGQFVHFDPWSSMF